jgi:hypothetical protein
MSISSSAVMCDLSISVWTARKLDKKVSEEVDTMKGTTVRAGNYSKNLLAGSASLDNIVKHASSTRLWNIQQTLPWSDTGTRLLPTRNFMGHKTGINDRRNEFNALCDTFYADYPNLVTSAVARLGAMCDLSEYPPVDVVRTKFRFALEYSPIAEAGDFRIDAENGMKEELMQQHADNLKAKEEAAMGDLWKQLHGVLLHMSGSLADVKTESGDVTHRRFRSTLIDNALSQCSLLTKLNITNDPHLEMARQELERTLSGVHVETVRDSADARNTVKSKVDAIIEKFNW